MKKLLTVRKFLPLLFLSFVCGGCTNSPPAVDPSHAREAAAFVMALATTVPYLPLERTQRVALKDAFESLSTWLDEPRQLTPVEMRRVVATLRDFAPSFGFDKEAQAVWDHTLARVDRWIAEQETEQRLAAA